MLVNKPIKPNKPCFNIQEPVRNDAELHGAIQ